MQKNTASQTIGAQLVSATTGAAFTGSVTVSVTGDAGTQATGSVGSGACTHEGNGYHTYAPAQAETNYDLIAFTFTGSGAVPVTVQVFTRPAGTPVITTDIPSATTIMAAVLDELTINVRAIGSYGALIRTNLDTTVGSRNATAPLDAAGTRAAIGMAAADLDDQLDAILEDTGTTLPASIAALAAAATIGQVVSDDGTMTLYEGMTYNGTLMPKPAWTVTKDYTGVAYTAITLTLWRGDGPDATVMLTTTATADSSTSITASFTATFLSAITYAGCPPFEKLRYDLVATQAGGDEEIDAGDCYVFRSRGV